ncbi:MAG: LysR family transcriptional regulator [Bdellovibrionaceae bacterium]|nr:LysR family transcriptional regulator [Pseudobdellovibrionaceae bacterium]
MLNLYQLQSFVTVISEGSMTGAADKLYLTQPAISQQIRNLEEELGVELLVRGVRVIKPTLQGEILFDFAKRILQQAAQAEVAVKALGAELKGQLKVGTLNSMGVQLMSPIVSRLLKYNSKLSIVIDYGEGPDLIQAFNRKDLDLLILPEVEKQFGLTLPDAEKRFLFKEEMWLVGSGKDMDMPKQIQVAEMSKYPLIFFSREYPDFNRRLLEVLKANNVEVEPTFISPNVGTLKRVIESALGWGFLPSSSIKKQVRSGRMNRVDVKDFSYELEFQFYTHQGMTQTSLSDVFYQALLQQERA